MCELDMIHALLVLLQLSVHPEQTTLVCYCFPVLGVDWAQLGGSHLGSFLQSESNGGGALSLPEEFLTHVSSGEHSHGDQG